MEPDQIAAVLGQPITLNKLALANRMVMGPMSAFPVGPGGAGTEHTAAFFEARARGGVAMIIVGGAAASSRAVQELGPRTVLRLDTDAFLPGLERVAEAVHAHGVPIIAEISAGMGRMAAVPMAASPVNVIVPKNRAPRGVHFPHDIHTRTPIEAPVEVIQEYERDLIATADRIRRAGWDGVEVAAHMSYFCASFLSPRTNKRTDQYGGSAENRARMLVNIVHGIRKLLGRDFMVGLRITSNEYLPDGQGAEGYAAIAKKVEKAGADYVALAPGCYETMDVNASAADGVLLDSGDARIFKQTLSIPVLLQGLHDPARSATAIAEGQGDIVMLARPTLADPDYARKVLEGRPNAIVQCKRDNYCMRRLLLNLPVRCEVNPQLGREGGAPRHPSAKSMVMAPIHEMTLKALGSKRAMSLIGAVMKKPV